MTRISKAIMAFFTSLGTWGVTAFADGELNAVEAFGLCGVIVATVGVFSIPNDAPAGEPPDPRISERGASDVAIVVAALVLAVALVLAFGVDNR